MIKIPVKMTLKSPLSHFSDERMGTMQIMRTTKLIVDDEILDVPTYSGNAFRGMLRRLIMKDFLELIGLNKEGVSPKLYHTLFTGGSLTSSTTRYEEIGERQEMQRLCPPLAILGTALGDKIPAGKFKSSLFRPICKETESITGIESKVSMYDLLEDVFYTRRDDLKSSVEGINNHTVEDKKKKDNPTQMKYEMQVLSTGAVLVGTVYLENGTDVEKSCLARALNLFKDYRFIGGKSSAGHGEMDMDFELDASEDIYLKHIEENKEEIKSFVRELEGIL